MMRYTRVSKKHIKNREMTDIHKALMEYLENTPRDVLQAQWDATKSLDKVGPTVEEYLEYSKEEIDLEFEFDQAERFFGQGNSNAGHLVLTKKGIEGRTYHSGDMVNGKVKVYTDKGKFLCNPDTLQVTGFID